MLKNFSRFKHSNRKNDSDETGGRIESALESMARHTQTIDPDTDAQWRSLKSTLDTGQSESSGSFVIPKRYILKPAISLAVVCTILIAIGVIWLKRSSTKIYETTRGQHSTVILQDSTKIILNSLSEISVNRRSIDKVRRVSLKGEAMFHVHRNEAPFIVTTDIGTVQVLGTEFNVRVRDDRMEVAVLSGSVKMSVKQNNIDSSIVLTKGQIAFCSKYEFPGMPDILPFADYPGWMNGRLMFYRSTLSSVCRELEMQFDIRIRTENPDLRTKTLTGVIDGQNAESAVKTLVQVTGTTIRYENGVYNIY